MTDNHPNERIGKIKKLFAILAAALILAACAPQTEGDNPNPVELINATESVGTSGLDVLWESELDNGAKVTLYLNGAAWEDGEFLGYETDHEWMLVYRVRRVGAPNNLSKKLLTTLFDGIIIDLNLSQ